jgi:hypothetical protein
MNIHLSFDEWLQYGMDNSWCGPAVCETHDGLPLTEEESEEFYEHGHDPCVHIVRLYESTEARDSVEKNHSPSVWRKPRRS